MFNVILFEEVWKTVRCVAIFLVCTMSVACYAPDKRQDARAETDTDVVASISPEATADIIESVSTAVRNEIRNETTQIQNDFWPIVWLLAVLGVVLFVVCGMVIRYWIKSHSYLSQKPRWEQMKETCQ